MSLSVPRSRFSVARPHVPHVPHVALPVLKLQVPERLHQLRRPHWFTTTDVAMIEQQLSRLFQPITLDPAVQAAFDQRLASWTEQTMIEKLPGGERRAMSRTGILPRRVGWTALGLASVSAAAVVVGQRRQAHA